MNKVYCNDLEINRYQGTHESSPEEYLNREKNVNKLLYGSTSADRWWPSDQEDSKFDSRKRWSYGSDASIEAIENVQTRLCCSPVDEFDSTPSSENEELIINNTDERDESYKDYLQTSPASSPSFKDVVCSDDGKDRSESNDVDTADDELIDYSKRYTTDSSLAQQQRNVANPVRRQAPEKKSAKVDPYGDYAETDLDQPTDYSLRYAEEDTDEDEKEDTPQFYCTREQEDTTKTYYTEGTPLETPLNFSASTSMSDLLSIDDGKEGQDVTFKRQFLREKQEKLTKIEKSPKDNPIKLKKKYVYEDPKIPVLLETPETNDCVTCNAKLKKSSTPPLSPVETRVKEKECKTVPFIPEPNSAQETPLMFSRCSSLDSLNEFDQHSIHDDHSSVVSDFSHRTSAVVSPSELPDSPTQTVPPSPRRLKQQSFQEPPAPSRVPISRPVVRKLPPREPQQNIKFQPVNNVPRRPDPSFVKPNVPVEPRSVFEDDVVQFFSNDMLSNKAHSTAASSLSALTIDDDDGVDECDNRDIMNKITAIRVRTSAAGMHQAPMQNQPQQHKVVNKPLDCRNNRVFSPPIREEMRYVNREKSNAGPLIYVNKEPSSKMQMVDRRNNRVFSPPVREEVHYVSLEKSNAGQLIYASKEFPNNRCKDSLKDPWRENRAKNNNQNYLNRSYSRSPVLAKRQNDFIYPAVKLEVEEVTAIDSTRIYCTEDTPTFISPFGSESNLSALSMLSISEENLPFTINSGDDEPPRMFYNEGRVGSRADAYDSDDSNNSNLSEDDFKGYDDGNRRIDVSPFDSQVNLDSLALLCIEEEDEEEDDDDEVAKSNNETDKASKDDYRTEDVYEESEEDHKLLEDCIKSGVRKVARQRDEQ